VESALADLLAATVALCALLVALAVARKLRRDRNEARFPARRRQLAELVFSGAPVSLATALRRLGRDRTAQVDLAIVLETAMPMLDGERREVLRWAVEAARLEQRLLRRLRSRDPVARRDRGAADQPAAAGRLAARPGRDGP
jgi:hypothetical protein